MPIITDTDLEGRLRNVAQQLGAKLQPFGIGFGLFFFRVNEPGARAIFATNVNREQLVTSVGRWTDAERAKQRGA